MLLIVACELFWKNILEDNEIASAEVGWSWF